MHTTGFGKDQVILGTLKALRLAGYGLTTIGLVRFLKHAELSDEQVGLFMTLTLVGDTVLSLYVSHVADQIGRRKMLCLSLIAMALSGAVFASTTNYWILLTAAVFGVISPSGDEVGPFRAIEEAALLFCTKKDDLPHVTAVQSLLGTFSMGGGMLLGGFIEDNAKSQDLAYRAIFWGYSGIAAVCFVLCCFLSSAVEAHQLSTPEETTPLIGSQPSNSSAGQGLMSIGQIALLLSFFAIDSLAYGFMTNSWIVEYFRRVFKSSPTHIAEFMFTANMFSAFSTLPSVALMRVLGPLKTVVLTKVGAGVAGGLVPLAQTPRAAMATLLCRSMFDVMDVVPRTIFLTELIPRSQYLLVTGYLYVAKTQARSLGPLFTGFFAGREMLQVCFYLLGGFENLFAVLVQIVYGNRVA